MEWLRFSMFLIPFFSWYMLIYGIRGLKEYYRRKEECILIHAQVIDYKTDLDDGTKIYAPIFEYELANKTYTNTSTIWSSKKPELSNNIKISVDPLKPEDSHEHSWFNTFASYFIPVASFIMLINGVWISYLLVMELL